MNYPMRGQTIKGFTLIEFLVASILAMIVIVAAGSTYFMTRKLSDEAQKRLTIQQNLRNATTQIMRDARMAGSFGCYNTSSTIKDKNAPITDTGLKLVAPEGNATEGGVLKLEAVDNAMGVRWGRVGGQDALIFIYGLGETPVIQTQGLTAAANNDLQQLTLGVSNDNEKATDPLRQALANKGNIVVSSCRTAIALNMGSAINNNTLDFKTHLQAQPLTLADAGELAVSQLYAAAYVHNADTKQLMRVDIGSDGRWQSPQLVAEGINNMSVSYAYADNCPIDSLSTDRDVVAETFTFTKTLATTAEKKALPAMVQVYLNYDVDTEATVDPATKQAKKLTADYIINATVRGGNVCGNRTPVPS